MSTNDDYNPRDWAIHPPYLDPSYKSTVLRSPRQKLIPLAQTVTETTGPQYDARHIGSLGPDLTKSARKNGEPLGERIVVEGRVLDENGRPVPNTLIEIWQANASGRYVHEVDQHDAPIDPNFLGSGRCVTDAEGRYSYITIKPGAYPWQNHHNAWRPAHIHYSLFGPSFATRLVTQMYFPGDPLLAYDPIYNTIPDPEARKRLICDFSMELTKPEWALGYTFDVVLRGRGATPMEN
ncbi:MAG TPA: protocatechuate 3,4-dioxygenase subunit beta [Alphaproteobacteria bacterium]|jgi:protocatechuate 3,4-dioxygenase beta subunit